MMTVKEKTNVVGETGLLKTNGFSFEVKILEVRVKAEFTYYLVTPISGSGEQWVEADNVTMEPLEVFLKNVLDVENDGLKQTSRYVIRAQYNVRCEDSRGVWYGLKHRVIEDITYTWDEIEQEGGIAEINKQLKECYNV